MDQGSGSLILDLFLKKAKSLWGERKEGVTDDSRTLARRLEERLSHDSDEDTKGEAGVRRAKCAMPSGVQWSFQGSLGTYRILGTFLGISPTCNLNLHNNHRKQVL